MDKITVEEFIGTYICPKCGVNSCKGVYKKSCYVNMKSDLRKVIEGLLPDKGVYSAKDVIDYIRKRLDEELGGGK